MSDARDFEELVRRHQGAVCAVAFSVLRDRARSEEVAQDAFLIAWQKLPNLAEPPTLPAWICGIARNLARNAARRPKEGPMADEPLATETPLDAVLDHEADEIAERALAALADADREVVVLYYRGDGSVADVAATLGITEPAARQRLHRGRERLKSAAKAVEASLRATRPGPAFTAGCVAALAAGVLPATADAASADHGTGAAQGMSPGAVAIAVGALAVVGIAVAVYATRGPATEDEATERGAGPSTAERHSEDREATGAATPARAGYGTRRPGSVVRRIAAPARTALVEAIVSARQQRASGSDAPAAKVYDFSGSVLDDLSDLPPVKPGPLSKTTIRYAIREIQPMLLECYTEAAPRLARKDGTITVVMRLAGEPDLGTIVESVTLGGDAHLLADAALAECMRETLMTVELPAMAVAETWDVNYPFVVR